MHRVLENNCEKENDLERRPAQNAGLPVPLNRRAGSPSYQDYRLVFRILCASSFESNTSLL